MHRLPCWIRHPWGAWRAFDDIALREISEAGEPFGRRITPEARVCRRCKEVAIRSKMTTLEESRELLYRSIAEREEERLMWDELTEGR